MEAEQKPCWAEERGAQSRGNFATCPWSGVCGLFGQQISLALVPAALACSLPLTTRTYTVSPGSCYNEENTLSLRRYILSCAKWFSHLYLFQNCPRLSATKRTSWPATELSGVSVSGWTGWWPGWSLAPSFHCCVSKGPSLWWAWKRPTSFLYTVTLIQKVKEIRWQETRTEHKNAETYSISSRSQFSYQKLSIWDMGPCVTRVMKCTTCQSCFTDTKCKISIHWHF